MKNAGQAALFVTCAGTLTTGRLVKSHNHLLRPACATHMHDHNAPLQAVATLLGHAKPSTAQIYTRVSVRRIMETYNRAHPHVR